MLRRVCHDVQTSFLWILTDGIYVTVLPDTVPVFSGLSDKCGGPHRGTGFYSVANFSLFHPIQSLSRIPDSDNSGSHLIT